MSQPEKTTRPQFVITENGQNIPGDKSIFICERPVAASFAQNLMGPEGILTKLGQGFKRALGFGHNR